MFKPSETGLEYGGTVGVILIIPDQGDGGVFANVMAATEERPWLWAVFVIALLVPVVLVAIFCFGRVSANYRNRADSGDDRQRFAMCL